MGKNIKSYVWAWAIGIIIILTLCFLLSSCTKEEYTIIPITIGGDSTYVNIGGDSTYVNVDINNNITDSSNVNINIDNDNVNNNENNNSIVDSTVINTATTNPSVECVEIPNAPIIVGIFQPTKASPYIGSVVIGNLPLKPWTLVRFPDKVIITGNTNSIVVEGLDSRWSSNNGAKCYSTKYSWLVINECGHTSPISATAEIKSY